MSGINDDNVSYAYTEGAQHILFSSASSLT